MVCSSMVIGELAVYSYPGDRELVGRSVCTPYVLRLYVVFSFACMLYTTLILYIFP